MGKERMDGEWQRRRNRREEKMKREEKGETQVEHINICEDTEEEDSFSDIQREMCEIYDRENEEE